jgi:hypothetical protein
MKLLMNNLNFTQEAVAETQNVLAEADFLNREDDNI